MTETVQLDDLGDGEAMRIEVDLGDADGPTPIAIVRIGEAVHAIGDICSHANVSLSEGEVWCDELELECPKHSSAFSLLTGEPSTLPATQPVEVFDAAIVDGRIEIARRSGDEGSAS